MAEQVDPQATTSDTSATSSDSSDTVVSNKTINEYQWRPKELVRMSANDADCTNVPKAPRLSTSEASGHQANDPIKLEQEPPIDIPFEPAKSPEYEPFATIPSTPKPDEASMFSKPKPDEASCWPKPVLDFCQKVTNGQCGTTTRASFTSFQPIPAEPKGIPQSSKCSSATRPIYGIQ